MKLIELSPRLKPFSDVCLLAWFGPAGPTLEEIDAAVIALGEEHDDLQPNQDHVGEGPTRPPRSR